MKFSLNQIVYQLINSTVGGLALTVLLSSPLLANNIPQRITNGLYRSSSEDFFEQGKRKLEEEIQILMQQLLIEPESLLNISNRVQIKDEELLENPEFLSDNIVKSKKER